MQKIKKFLKKIDIIHDLVFFYHAYNYPLHRRKLSKNRLKIYKNKYKCERCFVIGNGPSLKSNDLDKIKNEISFGANMIYNIFEETDWRPTFYCIQDNEVLNSLDFDRLKILKQSCNDFFVRGSSYGGINNNFFNTFDPICVSIWDRKKIGFSDSADKLIFDGWTVTYMSLQLAVYMGFKEIYLLGCDFSIPKLIEEDGRFIRSEGEGKAHFYTDNNLRLAFRSKSTEKTQLNAYKKARDFSESKDIHIYNATRGGTLEVFERVDFDTLFYISH